MNKSNEISIERLCWVLEQNQEWIKNCDTKTTTILALIGVYLPFFLRVIQLLKLSRFGQYFFIVKIYVLQEFICFLLLSHG